MDEEREGLDRPIPPHADDFVPLLESNAPVMQRLLEKAKRAATSAATILLTGESGTDKDVLAHQIHRWSARAECPFVTVNCTGHAEHLLDEISDLTVPLQTKLLHFIKEQSFERMGS